MIEVMFSIIIPLYNKEKQIKRTIESVLTQTVQDFELIIVNDGSTDNSISIVESIKSEKIILINQENQGVSVARNNGVERSKGKYICFLDADDIWMPNYLEIVSQLYTQFPTANMTTVGICIKYVKKQIIPRWDGISSEKSCIIENYLKYCAAKFWIINSSNSSFKSDFLKSQKQLFPVGETVNEDFDLWIRLYKDGIMAHSPNICSIYIREAEGNARRFHSNKIVYSNTFMSTLDSLIYSDKCSDIDKVYLKEIRDRRMVPYIFSLLLTKNKKKASEELKLWSPSKQYKKHKACLMIISFLPTFILFLIQKIRLKVF